jgi:hypothetical protein
MDIRPASKTVFNFITIIFFRLTPSVVRHLRDNYHFLFPITKADVCNRPEKFGRRDWVESQKITLCGD